MFSKPKRAEINHHTIKLIIGVIAISLAFLTSLFSNTPLQSISASYHEDGWSRDIFVGFLFAIFALLLAYNGKDPEELPLSKVAAIAAIGVAMFPCKCGNHLQIFPYVHGFSAAVMFLVLAFFCYIFFQRARNKPHLEARLRAYIYAFCGITIVMSVLIILFDHLSGGAISSKIVRLTFYGEALGLFAFGVAWLIASQILPFINNKKERISLSPFSNS